MLGHIDKSLMKNIYNSNEFKGWLLSRRWFGDKSALSNLEFNIKINYFEILAERIFLSVIDIQTKDYSKSYFLPLLYYKKLPEILEKSEKMKENVIRLTENTFSKKIALEIQGEQKVFTLNLLEAEYSLFFWKKLLFDKTLAELFPKLSLNLTLYEDQFQDEVNMKKVQGLIEANLYPTLYDLSIEQLGKGNTTNSLFLLTIKNIKKPEVEFSYVLKSYKEFLESIEPSTLFVLVKNKFPNAPKIYGTIKIQEKETIGILENVLNLGNLGDIYWNELNNMIYKVFRDLREDYSFLSKKGEISNIIKENCKETLKVSNTIGKYIKKLHKSLILPEDADYSSQSVKSEAYLKEYTDKLNGMITELQDLIDQNTQTTFINLPKINSILIDIKDIIERFRNEFKKPDIIIQPVHQDLHMEQILYNKSNDDYIFYFIDFEGDPQLSVDERKGKFPIEKDLASFLRALSYIKFNTLLEFIEKKIIAKESYEVPEEVLYNMFFRKAARSLHEVLDVILKFLDAWEIKLMNKLLRDLNANTTLITYFYIERALHELSYEMLFRPSKIIVPILGLKEIIERN
ncbi:MAG: hypothetical protein ACTSR8_22510 [Promethearchaeota archaeon]